MAKKEVKTNAMRTLEREGITFEHLEYDPAETDGQKVAALLGQDESIVFKTLVTEAPGRRYYVFVIPVSGTLDLKKAAAAAGEKSLSMLKQKDLLPLTGYVHGGCSPIGMKKLFTTYFHYTAESYPSVSFSAGKIGEFAELDIRDLSKVIRFGFADLTTG